ncbi:PDZ and LIM domain protein Zasp isoform X5 [Culicoides brevitarsis]|uniref:PDZ and LIM domain protein Zasp isoform X5 n=1 Tax=Culicoides brevitarsis TaxID=469753 RepID=UPI00307CC5FE
MAQLMTVRLTRNDGQPWGFRLQGGKDFGSPLALQKVNVGSIADKAGLLAGDALIRVNNEELFNLRHKDAQDALVRAGNSFELTVSRGGSTWKPSVTPLTSPVPTSAGINVVTKTSLKAMPGQNVAAIGTGHNTAAKPFASNGQGVRSIVNKQYNTPVAMYSDETIAETLSAQTEVLAGGVLGVNFKKNEKVYNSAQSEVFKMLQEQGHEPEPARPSSVYSPSSNFASQHQEQCVAPVTQHVSAPVNVPKPPSNNGLPPGQNICADCERLIVGVFVRIKDKNLHVECFKCSTCGTSLKNQGYYNLNNKLYCDIHARLAALNSPPPNSNGMVPVTLTPKAPLNTISSALNAHAFNGSSGAATTAQLPSTVSGPKPFSYATPSTFGPTSPPQAVNTPKSPIAYPPAPAPTWSVPPAQAPVFTPKPTESMKAPAVQNLQGKFNVYKQPTSTPRKEPQSIVTAVSIEPKDVSVEEEKPKATEGGISGKPYNVQNVTQPKRGRGVLNQGVGPSGRSPMCGCCGGQVRGPFITALGRIWCPEHFICVNANCKRPLADIGFVEEKGDLYCEYCFEQYLAPNCNKCAKKIKGDCLNAIGKQFHPECFTCSHCGKLFGNSPFFLEEGEPFCQNDWNQLFTTKCFACGFPVEAGDRWVEALNNNYHSQCFNCTMCKKNLEGQSFYAKGGRPFCKNHAR